MMNVKQMTDDEFNEHLADIARPHVEEILGENHSLDCKQVRKLAKELITYFLPQPDREGFALDDDGRQVGVVFDGPNALIQGRPHSLEFIEYDREFNFMTFWARPVS